MLRAAFEIPEDSTISFCFKPDSFILSLILLPISFAFSIYFPSKKFSLVVFYH
nr:MAG TPA: hypothetical protein [Inoviridae sp.]